MPQIKKILILEQYSYSFFTLMVFSLSSYLYDIESIGELSLIIVLSSSWYSIFEQSFFYQYLRNKQEIPIDKKCQLLNTQLIIFIIIGLIFFLTILPFLIPYEIDLLNTHFVLYFGSCVLFEHVRKILIAHDYGVNILLRSVLRIVPLIFCIIISWLSFIPKIETLIFALGTWNLVVAMLHLPKPIRKLSFKITEIIVDTKSKLLACRFLSLSVIIDNISNLMVNIILTRLNGLAWIAAFRIYQNIFGIINPIIQFVFLEYFKSHKQTGYNTTYKLLCFSGFIFIGLFFVFDDLLVYIFSDQVKFNYYFFVVFTFVYLVIIAVNHRKYLVIIETNGRLMFVASIINSMVMFITLIADNFFSFLPSNHWILLWASLSLVKLLILSPVVKRVR